MGVENYRKWVAIKLIKIGAKKCPKSSVYKLSKPGVQNDQNFTQNDPLKISSKSGPKLISMGGVKNVKKCQKSTPGTPDPQKRNFR
jgi:hypothetical protein